MDYLVKHEYNDINPFILDDETNRKLNTSHYVLGDDVVRNLQKRHQERLRQVQELADKLGVKIVKREVDKEKIIRDNETYTHYYLNRDLYDSFINESLELQRSVGLKPSYEVLLRFLENYNSPK